MRELVQRWWSLERRWWREESGQGMVEYALIIALIAIGLFAVFLYLRNATGNVFDTTADSLSMAPTPGHTTDP